MVVASGVVFDIDDTLYLERNYVASGFRAVADHLTQRIDLDREIPFGILWGNFEDGVRGRAFDILLEKLQLVEDISVNELVEVYRSHEPAITLTRSNRFALQGLVDAGHRIGVISDGPAPSQAAKADALGLLDFAHPLILTDELGARYSKPHPRAFEVVEEAWGLNGADVVYVADNPTKDFVAPNRRGWRSIRVRCPGQLHEDMPAPSEEHRAQVEVSGVVEACQLILDKTW